MLASGIILLFLDRLSKFFALRAGIAFKNQSFYGILALVAVSFFIFLFLKYRQIGYFWVILGGLSNLLDYFIYGYVIDLIQIPLFPFFYFNLADILIFGGIVCLIFNLKKLP